MKTSLPDRPPAFPLPASAVYRGTSLPPVPHSEREVALSLLPPGKTWFSVNEAAEALGVSSSFIRARLEAGQLLCCRLGKGKHRRHGRIHRDHLALYLLDSLSMPVAEYSRILADLLLRLPRSHRAELLHLISNPLDFSPRP